MNSVYNIFFDSLNNLLAPDRMSLSKNLDIEKLKNSLTGNVYRFATNFFKLSASGTIIAGYGCAYLAYSLVTHPYISISKYFINKKPEEDSKTTYQAAQNLPDYYGYSTSVFQDCGAGTEKESPKFKGKSNWDKWLTPEHIKGETDFSKFFVNYLDHPKEFAQLLKDQGINSFRLSLERSIIQTNNNNSYDEIVIQKYKTLFQALKNHNIEPLVTLHHFTEPQWFEDIGRFEKEDNINSFVSFSLKMMEIFKDDVTNWMTFNEPGIYVFQTYIRKVYPGKGHESIAMAGKVLRNILIAHMRIYKQAKAKYQDNVQIGFTHQWLKFVPFNENNPIEKITCQILSHITYGAVYDFFKKSDDNTHKFSYKIPGICNTELEVEDEKGQGFMDFIGVQHYGYPVMKIGFNYGTKFPGNSEAVTNLNLPWIKCGLTFGATSFENGSVASFGPPYSPETLMDALTEASHYNKPIMITETGFDRRVYKKEQLAEEDEEIQKRAYEAIAIIAALTKLSYDEISAENQQLINRLKQLVPDHDGFLDQKIEDFCKAQINLTGLLYWTFLSRQLEWENGDKVHLGALKDVKIDPNTGQITNITYSSASIFLQKLFNNVLPKEEEDSA